MASSLRRWLAAALILIASPCAIEGLLDAVALAAAPTVERDGCCPSHETRDEAPAPDDTRVGCPCCHTVGPPPALALPTMSDAPAMTMTFATLRGEVVDGHTLPPFRPPTIG